VSRAGDIGFARYLLSIFRQARDAGDLQYAEAVLGITDAQVPADDQTPIADELRLTLLLEKGTVSHDRDEMEDAERLASEAVEFSEEKFRPGIQRGRARLRLYYVWEGRGRWADAIEANFRLADDLRGYPTSAPLRLNCLTRSLASGVKNADRAAQSRAVREGRRLAAELRANESREILAWFFLWEAMAQIRQYQREDARRLLNVADSIAVPVRPPKWRWGIVAQMALGNLLWITSGREEEGRSLVRDARAKAESRGFRYLVRSLDEIFKHLDPTVE
jgi:hypothetical protein